MICKAPFLPYDKIRSLAEGFLNKYNSKASIPVQIEEIIEFDLNMEIIPFMNLQKQYSIDGWLSADLASIYVDEWIMDNRENRYRFTLAHELGHKILHSELYDQIKFRKLEEWLDILYSIDADQYSWFEKQANDFAGLILVPRDELFQAYQDEVSKLEAQSFQLKRANVCTINEYISIPIAKKFAVSQAVVNIRISNDDLSPFIV